MKQHLMSSVYFAGNAHPSDVHLGWVLSQDNTLVAMADSKEIKSVADIMCDVAKHQGVTEIRIVDHTVQPKAIFC